MLAIYATTLFVSAFLMFLVQPMFGKMVLPLLGGSPAVWNTVVVFCQGSLLLGYLYAHVSARRLSIRPRALIQCLLVLLPLIVLPIKIPSGWSPPTAHNPGPWLLLVLLISVGPPFFVVSTISPMMQEWFARTRHRKAEDPYFLYAASNGGSMLGLLAYPLLVEPYFPLADQSWIWAAGYGLLIVLILACAVTVLKFPRAGPTDSHPAPSRELTPANSKPLTTGRRLRWVLWAFAPSSLMLSVTTYLSTNIAPVPLLWVIPLAVYLLTLILVFTRKRLIPHRIMVRAFPILVLPLVMVIILHSIQPVWLLVLLHLIAFFVIAMVCHGAIANDRPAPAHLTEFYLLVSLGGVMGGGFNALLAPLLFPTLVEYPLVVVLSAIFMAWAVRGEVSQLRWADMLLPAGLGILAAGMVLGTRVLQFGTGLSSVAIAFGLPLVLCYSLAGRPLRFGLGLGALLLVHGLLPGGEGRALLTERSFFGVHRVLLDPEGSYHILLHGRTLHGQQSLEASRRCEPLSYYHRTGPLGQLFAAFSSEDADWRVAAVGLGSGSIASYTKPGQQWTFYEIDPTVVRIASDPRYFTYLRDCGPGIEFVLGDARLSLAAESSRQFDLLVLDAYNSDSVPIHLITREALELYMDRVPGDGLLMFHISSQYLDLAPVLGNLGQDAGLVCLVQNDAVVSALEMALGKRPSTWVVMARTRAHLGKLAEDPRWQPLEGSPHDRVWTDSYSSIFSILYWH